MMRIIYESTVLDSWQLTIGLGFPMGVVLETLITVLVQVSHAKTDGHQ
jgi:hypothetical protein